MQEEVLEALRSQRRLRCQCVECGRYFGQITPGSRLISVCEKCKTENWFVADAKGILTVFSTPKEKPA